MNKKMFYLNKKILFTILTMILISVALVSCGNNKQIKNEKEDKILINEEDLTSIGYSIIDNLIYEPNSIDNVNGKILVGGRIFNNSEITIESVTFLNYFMENDECNGYFSTMYKSPLKPNEGDVFVTEFIGDTKIQSVEDLKNSTTIMSATIKDLDGKDLKMLFNYGTNDVNWTKEIEE